MKHSDITKEMLENLISECGFIEVPENKREDFFPFLFKDEATWMLRGENYIYNFLEKWLADYNGTYLQFYKSTDGKFGFVVPTNKELNETYNVQNAENWFDGELNSLQLGVAVTLMALNCVCWAQHGEGKDSSTMSDAFYEHQDRLYTMLQKLKLSVRVQQLLS